MDLFLAAECVRERLAVLSDSLGELAGAIEGLSDVPSTVARHEHGERVEVTRGPAAVRLASTAFRRLDYHNDQDERRVVRYVGAISVPVAVIRLADTVNEHKASLVEAIGAYRKLASKRERDSHQVRDLLIRLGYARLNLVQTYRKVPILERAPTRIGFTWILGTKHVETVDRDGAMRRVPGDVERSGSDLARVRPEQAQPLHRQVQRVLARAPS